MRIGIIGAGEMGSTHARAYARFGRSEGVEIAGIVSRRRERARRLGRELGAPAFTDLARILADDTVDAIDVAVPSGLHRMVVLDALANGKHVFSETPLALTLQDADAMIAAARRSRRILMVAQVMRFVADNIQIHAEATSGALGRPRRVVARRLTRPYWSSARPRPFPVYGEPLVELSIHDFDLANWILGRAQAVMASGVGGRGGVPVHAFASIEYPRGTALVEGGADLPMGFPFTTGLRVDCEAGVLDQESQFLGAPIPTTRFFRYTKDGREAVRVRGHDPYEAECRHFVRAVQRKADPSALSAEADRDALQVAIAARESIRSGGRVPVT